VAVPARCSWQGIDTRQAISFISKTAKVVKISWCITLLLPLLTARAAARAKVFLPGHALVWRHHWSFLLSLFYSSLSLFLSFFLFFFSLSVSLSFTQKVSLCVCVSVSASVCLSLSIVSVVLCWSFTMFEMASLQVMGPRLWNSLPTRVKQTQSICTLKKELKLIFFSKYKDT